MAKADLKALSDRIKTNSALQIFQLASHHRRLPVL